MSIHRLLNIMTIYATDTSEKIACKVTAAEVVHGGVCGTRAKGSASCKKRCSAD